MIKSNYFSHVSLYSLSFFANTPCIYRLAAWITISKWEAYYIYSFLIQLLLNHYMNRYIKKKFKNLETQNANYKALNQSETFIFYLIYFYIMMLIYCFYCFLTLLLFQLTKTQVLAKTVVFQVFDSDIGKDKPLGEVIIIT